MKVRKILALALALCMLLSLGAFASGTPDTSKGGKATSAPPDNSTLAMDILGTRAAVSIDYSEETGYSLSKNITGAYDVEFREELTAPTVGASYEMGGIRIECKAVDWDAENTVGNSGIIINARTDEQTLYTFGGDEDFYEAPDGKSYNSLIVMNTDPSEAEPEDAKETAPGVGIGFNGKSIEMKNVYVESNGTGRPSVHIPSKTRDKNATQLPDLICVDSTFINHDTRALLLMGGDVWFLNSAVYTNSWGGLSYDNTSTTMRVVNSDVQNIGTGGYAIYDAAGCTAYVYGSRVLGGNVGITVCRNATLTVDSLENADTDATAPYDGKAELLKPAATADGRTVIAAYDQPIMMHADMAGPDSQATAYISNTYISTMPEDVQFADGTNHDDWVTESTGYKALLNAYQSGACAIIRSHSGKLVFNNCELKSRTGILVHSQFIYDSMASGIYPVEDAEYVGNEVVFKNMSATGDILHEDYMRKMTLSLESAELNGAVVGTTLAKWNNYWREQVAAIPSDELPEATDTMSGEERALQYFIYNDSYATVYGVRMSIDADSVWNVTGDSNLASLTVADPDSIRGEGLEIYVGCAMSNDAEAYDISTGTKLEKLEAGKTYEGVVILVDEAAQGETFALNINGVNIGGVSVNTDDGTKYSLGLGDLLDLFGIDVSYDESTDTVSVDDPGGLVSALIGVK